MSKYRMCFHFQVRRRRRSLEPVVVKAGCGEMGHVVKTQATTRGLPVSLPLCVSSARFRDALQNTVSSVGTEGFVVFAGPEQSHWKFTKRTCFIGKLRKQGSRREEVKVKGAVDLPQQQRPGAQGRSPAPPRRHSDMQTHGCHAGWNTLASLLRQEPRTLLSPVWP